MSSAAFHRVNRHDPCPICGKTDWCRTFEDGGVECMRVESPVSCKSGGWMHYPEGDWRDHITTPPVTTVITNRTAPELTNIVYKALMKHLPLNPEHHKMLLDRGLDFSQYRSLPQNDRAYYAEKTRRSITMDYYLGGVPGFYKNDYNAWDIAGRSGLLIPIRNAANQIVGMQIRKDEGEPRYSFLSSRGYPGGTGSGSPVHVRNGEFNGTAIITEGPLKADYVHATGGQNVIAVPGVNNIRGVIPALQSMNIKKVVVAFDMDWKTNRQVKAARAKLMQVLWCEGYGVSSLSWDPAYKGIDDAMREEVSGPHGCDLIQTDYDPDGAVPCARIYEGGW